MSEDWQDKRHDNDPASRPDEENPEWTLEETIAARPALEVFAEIWGPEFADKFRRGRGRPVKPVKKVNQTLRLDPDVLDAFRQAGAGWQSRINQILRDNMPKSPA